MVFWDSATFIANQGYHYDGKSDLNTLGPSLTAKTRRRMPFSPELWLSLPPLHRELTPTSPWLASSSLPFGLILSWAGWHVHLNDGEEELIGHGRVEVRRETSCVLERESEEERECVWLAAGNRRRDELPAWRRTAKASSPENMVDEHGRNAPRIKERDGEVSRLLWPYIRSSFFFFLQRVQLPIWPSLNPVKTHNTPLLYTGFHNTYNTIVVCL